MGGTYQSAIDSKQTKLRSKEHRVPSRWISVVHTHIPAWEAWRRWRRGGAQPLDQRSAHSHTCVGGMAAVAARGVQQAGTMGGVERQAARRISAAGMGGRRRRWVEGQNPTNERPFLLLVAALRFSALKPSRAGRLGKRARCHQ
nr:unnamed protein product [Digitaria exilis]